MTDQHIITATPKYNFPRPVMDAAFSNHFLEQSLKSLENLHMLSVQLNQQTVQQPLSLEGSVHSVRFKSPSITLKACPTETTVGAVDTSSIRLGETVTGILVAVRGTTVWKHSCNYRYARFGPFIFHITEENRQELYRLLAKSYCGSIFDQRHPASPNLMQMPIRIASLLERRLQSMLTKTTNSGLLLFDGSLTAGTPETPTALMKSVLDTARNHGNIVLAFSKMTTLRIGGRLITDIPFQIRPPFLLEMEGLRPRPPQVLLGEVYVARLGTPPYSFRLDIDREIPLNDRVSAVERLLASDIALQGYPETLRLAHILCTFTANEVIAMQHFAARQHGLRLVCRPDMHSILFGPYGKGEPFS